MEKTSSGIASDHSPFELTMSESLLFENLHWGMKEKEPERVQALVVDLFLICMIWVEVLYHDWLTSY